MSEMADFIREYDPLREGVTPLATLATVTPSLLEEVIVMAMVMGIRAAEAKRVRDEKYALAGQDLDRAKANFWDKRLW